MYVVQVGDIIGQPVIGSVASVAVAVRVVVAENVRHSVAVGV